MDISVRHDVFLHGAGSDLQGKIDRIEQTISRLETLMATALENLTRELAEQRGAFEDLKAAVAGRLDTLNATVTALQQQVAEIAVGNSAMQGAADTLDGLQTDMQTLADQVRGSTPTDGGVVVGDTGTGGTPPADTGTGGTTDPGTTGPDGTGAPTAGV